VPYKDLEGGLYQVLGNVFETVYALKSMDDKAFIAEKGISIVLRPTIGTSSNSTSLLTWPPTAFVVIIEIKAFDAAGKQLWADTVTAKGNAEFDEFKSDFGLAAKRASEAARALLQVRLIASGLGK
jgi:hypothetical protein